MAWFSNTTGLQDTTTCSYCFIISGICQPLLDRHCGYRFAGPQGHQIWQHAATASLLLVYANHFLIGIVVMVFQDHRPTRYGNMQLPLHLFWSMQTTSEYVLWLLVSKTTGLPDMVTYSYCLMISGVCQPLQNMHCDHRFPRPQDHQMW